MTVPTSVSQKAAMKLARQSYEDYLTYVYQGMYQHARHTRLICSKLKEVLEHGNKRLMIFMPPRHSKSYTVTESFPSYFLLKNPDKRVICLAYGDALAKRFGRENRKKIVWFGRDLFGLKLAGHNSATTLWEIEGHAGGMYSTTIEGGVTGHGADLLIIDDPIKSAMTACSQTYRDRLFEEYTASFRTRLHSGGSIILIQTRWHEDDLAGRLLDSHDETWEVVSLPAVCETEYDLLGRQIGDPLWPARGFDAEWAERTKNTVGSRVWESLYQQHPTVQDGNIFKRTWMTNYYSVLPYGCTVIQSWDLPFKKSEGSSKCAGIVMGRKGADIYIIDMINEQMEFTESVAAVRQLSAKHPEARAKVVEDKANGPAIISFLRKEIPGMISFEPKGSKEDRALSVAPYFEAGNILFPKPTGRNKWVFDLIDDLVKFPNAKYLDTTDATVQGILYLMGKPSAKFGDDGDGLNKESYWRRAQNERI